MVGGSSVPQSETQACGCIATCIQQRPMSHVIAALVPGAAWCFVCGASPAPAPATTTAAAACICIPLHPPPLPNSPIPRCPALSCCCCMFPASASASASAKHSPSQATPKTWLASWCSPPASQSITMRPFLAELGPDIIMPGPTSQPLPSQIPPAPSNSRPLRLWNPQFLAAR